MTKKSPFTLAACAEMLWLGKPIEWRCAKLAELGFQVGLWNCRYVGACETSYFMTLFGQEDDLNEPERTRYSAQTAHS